MKETNLTIPTPDNHNIYATLNTEQHNTTLAILVHGLTGDMNYHLFYNAARYFPEHGCDTLRINLYDRRTGGRKLKDCTIAIHTQDIEKIIDHVQQHFPDYTHIFLIGHSLGGPSIFGCQSECINGMIGRDPTLLDDNMIEKFQKDFIPLNDMFYGNRNIQPLLSSELIDERKKLDNSIRNTIDKQTLIITGGKSVLEPRREREKLPRHFTHISINQAGHSFDETNTAQQLYDETLKWLKKQSFYQ